MSDKLTEAKRLWELLSHVCVDDEGCIDTEFEGFEIGTPRFEIWAWFEDRFDCSVATDLIGIE